MLEQIADFMNAGNQKVPEKPRKDPFSYECWHILNRVLEEYHETRYAKTTAEALDGFLDIAYVAFTGALHVAGLKATEEAWKLINRANTSKIDGTYGPTVTDPLTGKILKPEGFKHPNIQEVIDNAS
ncbi:hypothetical protein [Corynebacterium pyruviciproducens]|uniref:Phosphoribosyl-ATP diphosphatase n=1 Tax=Corynebacterium pyruviciproducens TaxID=598660 RepID=A0AAF1BT33_9CORY|nr:hypothetical protein [Corynebacterium pyruviciproducens]WOT03408.1 hypothetical protein CYJ47_06550 [Corynebacterium pyruviciproducens]